MADLELRYPGIIRFGWGVRRDLNDVVADVTGGLHPDVLLVSSGSVARSGSLDDLTKGYAGHIGARFSQVPSDPPLASVDLLVRLARSVSAGAIVAVGGGSVIDAAKAAAPLVTAAGTVADYFSGERTITGPGIPLISLPTTAGTGAEITKNSVLTEPDEGVKRSLRSPYMVPAAALVDPELTVTLPPQWTAWSGLDALTQAVESYLSTRGHSVSRCLALKATALLMDALPMAVRDGRRREARCAVAEGSLLSAMAFSQSGLGAVHGLAHPLGVALGMPHGKVCAILLPAVLRWNAPVCEPLLLDLARAAGAEDGAGLIASVDALCRQLGTPSDFSAEGLVPAHFGAIVANCRSGSMSANPRPMSDTDVRDLLAALC